MGNAEKHTRQKIMTIAREHFSRYGYAGTNLEAIGKEAGMTRGPLYYYVKKALVSASTKIYRTESFCRRSKNENRNENGADRSGIIPAGPPLFITS